MNACHHRVLFELINFPLHGMLYLRTHCSMRSYRDKGHLYSTNYVLRRKHLPIPVFSDVFLTSSLAVNKCVHCHSQEKEVNGFQVVQIDNEYGTTWFVN